jgi:hypothetical protein
MVVRARKVRNAIINVVEFLWEIEIRVALATSYTRSPRAQQIQYITAIFAAIDNIDSERVNQVFANLNVARQMYQLR